MSKEFDTDNSKIQQIMDVAYARWQKNRAMSQEEFWLRLSYPEKVAVFVGNLNYQVCNGGFLQWHDNEYSDCERDLLAILKIVGGCEEVIDLIKKALSELRAYDFDEYGDRLDYDQTCVDACDNRFYEINDDMLSKVEAYLLKEKA